MTLIRRTAVFLFSFLIIITLFSFTTSAENESEALKDIYLNPYGRTLCCASRGYCKSSPENSLSAVRDAAAAGADMVKIDIKKTNDGVLILMADDTVERTCCGYGEKTAVADMTYEELSSLRLLAGKGGSLAGETGEKVPTLEEIFGDRQNLLYLLDAPWEYRDDIYALAEEYGMLDSVIFLARSVGEREMSEWKKSLPRKVMTMTYFKGNVIFAAISAVNKAVSASDGAYLATKVPYGVVFGETVTKKADGKIRLAANTADNTLCGTIREDTEVWWDDLISRGYSVIITDYVPELKAYIDECDFQAQKLADLYNEVVENWKLPDISSDAYLDYKHNYNNAAEASEKILKNAGSAKSDIVTAYYELQKSYDDINSDYESLKNGTAGMTVTPVRIMLCVLAAAAVICAEVFIYKKKRKDK